MANVGYWSLILTFILSTYGAIVLTIGARRGARPLQESGRNGLFAAVVTSTAAVLALFYLLYTKDYSVRYVYEHVSSFLSPLYTLSAFWAGQEGSLLLWVWFVALLSLALSVRSNVLGAGRRTYALISLAFAQAFLTLVVLLISSPFETTVVTPLEGNGLNPLLQNIGMVLHPPIVFLGYALYTVPFALALGALFSKEVGPDWVREVRLWSLLAWLCMSVGILLGAWWAYLELGWGGYWAWDPVENASLIPWLTGTALVHSLMVQERRGGFKIWNMALISVTFLLCIFATFVTRSGVIQSVHAFGRSVIGYYFMAFILLVGAVMAILIYRRRSLLRSPFEVSKLFSRESSFLLTNLGFGGAAVIVLLGTLFPALTEAIQGRQAALGADFYGRTVVPLATVIVLLIGVCPWLGWGGVSAKRLRRDLLLPVIGAAVTVAALLAFGFRLPFALFAFAVVAFVGISIAQVFYQLAVRPALRSEEGALAAVPRLVVRNRRRYGAHIVHLGIVLVALGITGSSAYQSEVQVALAPGESVAHQGYTLQYRDLVSQSVAGIERFAALISVQRNGREIGTLRPEKNYHQEVDQWVSEVDTRSTLREDLYVSLAGVNQDGLATFQVLVNPLISWIWIGGGALLLGALIALWPARVVEEQHA